jgi:tetratricopeptide (TPR) repeat protein
MSEAEGGGDVPGAPSDGQPPPSAEGGFLAALSRWQQVGLAVAGVLTVAAQLWIAVEKQWQLTAVTAVIALVAIALYVLSHRGVLRDPRMAAFARYGAIALLIAVPVLSMAGLFAYSYLPRLRERGTTVAIARFDGPPLPAPYDNCRPSDMLLQTLAQIADRFGGVTVFELPYSVHPTNRWARFWAQSHGWFEGADVIVYGEYSLHRSAKHVTDEKPDEVTISPRVDAVPRIPIADKSAPLYAWTLPSSVANIDQLCGGALPDTKASVPFLDDARRISLAVVGAQFFGVQGFVTAERALHEAKIPNTSDDRRCDGDPAASGCPGVLAFYLASLDQRMGHYPEALREYAFAAAKLDTAAAYIDLGELSMQMGRPDDAFKAFGEATRAEPGSVAAVATRAQYERDYLRPREAAIDLDRALHLSTVTAYDASVLSRALYQRGGSGDAACGIAALESLIAGRGFDQASNLDTMVRYALWLRGAQRHSEASRALENVVRIDPQHIKANYALGRTLEDEGPVRAAAAKAYLERAATAPAYTDEEYLDQANASNELRKNFDAGSSSDRRSDLQAALGKYQASIALNPAAVYAYYDRALLEAAVGNGAAAERDFQKAVALHPFDALILSGYGQYLDARGRMPQGATFHARAREVSVNRIPPDDAATWSSRACSYEGMDLP